MAFDIQIHKKNRQAYFSWQGRPDTYYKDMSIVEIEEFIEYEKHRMTKWFLETLENEIIYKKLLNRIRNATKL